MLEFRPGLLEIRPIYNFSKSLIYLIKQNLYYGRFSRKNFGQISSFFGPSPKIYVQCEPLVWRMKSINNIKNIRVLNYEKWLVIILLDFNVMIQSCFFVFMTFQSGRPHIIFKMSLLETRIFVTKEFWKKIKVLKYRE